MQYPGAKRVIIRSLITIRVSKKKPLTGNVQNITMNFNSAKDGSFSKQSAEQAGRAAIHAMNRFSNKTN